MLRTATTLAIIGTVLSGSGLPMCVSLVARAAEPCAMHQHDQDGHMAHAVQVVAGHPDDACHSGDGTTGCATDGTCPAGGTASVAAPVEVLVPTITPNETPATHHTYLSFLSPPLSPPPQV